MATLFAAIFGASIWKAAAGLGLRFIEWLFGTKPGRITLLVLALLAGLGFWTWHVYDKATIEQARKDKAAELALTQAALNSQLAILQRAQREGAATAARLSLTEKKYADALAKNRRLSAVNRGKPCLDDGSSRRLRELERELGRGDPSPALGAEEPAG